MSKGGCAIRPRFIPHHTIAGDIYRRVAGSVPLPGGVGVPVAYYYAVYPVIWRRITVVGIPVGVRLNNPFVGNKEPQAIYRCSGSLRLFH